MAKLFFYSFWGIYLSCFFDIKAQQVPQFSFSHSIPPELIIDNQVLTNPWSGGINTAQVSTINLNMDEYEDLVVFDKTYGRLSTYLAIEKRQ